VVQIPLKAEFFLCEIYIITPNFINRAIRLVTVGSVKNSNSLSPIDGISVAVKSAKGEIRVSESDTWLAKMTKVGINYIENVINCIQLH
jgi:hypothetical protein